MLGKQWILYYTRVTTWGNIVDRGQERQAKLAGLQKWGLHLIMESLPVMLQFALLLFGVALATYLWDLNVTIAEVVVTVTSVGLAFYTCIAVAATMYHDCPFQTPLSILLPGLLPRAKEFTTLARVWLRRKATSLPIRIEHAYKIFASGKDTPDYAEEDLPGNDNLMKLSNPAFWRDEPIFTAPLPKDIGASAAFWLLENSTDTSAASSVAAVFSELQWPSHHCSTTALKRLHDTYVECFRAPEFKESSRLKALQSAAAYYVLYHTQLIWSTSNRLQFNATGKLHPDLLLQLHSEKWGGDDVFEHLLRIEDRSEPVTSARFLSYIAPYWFCGDSDSAVRFRSSRLPTMYKLIKVLEEYRVLDALTLTDCVLSVGAAMDFPLHPEDLVRLDKRYVPPSRTLTLVLIFDSDYFALTFKLVVEHTHGLVLSRGRRRRHAKTALDILHTLAKKAPFPLIDPAWIRELLKSAAGGNMDDETFTLFLRLSARRKEEDAGADMATPHGQDHVGAQGCEPGPQSPGETIPPDTATPEHTLFIKIMQNVRTRSKLEGGWQDDAVYGGLIAMGDIPRLGSCLPDSDSLETLFKAMDRSQPFRVRKATYDVVLAARDGWLRSPGLRQTLEDLDFPRQLYSVVNETGRPCYQRSFLKMMEILLDDGHWHSYLRGAMDIWLPFRHEAPRQVLRIIARIGKLPVPRYEHGSNPSHFDRFLGKVVEDEWKGVPGRRVADLTADNLKPLAEITKQFKGVLFTETDRRAVLVAAESVIPALERRLDNGYEGPWEGVRRTVNDLLEVLRVPVQSDQRSIHSFVD